MSILQGVTLGGKGKESGDCHPKVREGVMIGAGAKILGNIEVGKYAKISGLTLLYSNLCLNMPLQQAYLLVLLAKTKRHAFEMNQYFIDDDINLNI